MPYKEVKQKAAETRAKLTGTKPTTTTTTTNDEPAAEETAAAPPQMNGKKQKTLSNGVGGLGVHDVVKAPSNGEASGAPAGDGDVQMTG